MDWPTDKISLAKFMESVNALRNAAQRLASTQVAYSNAEVFAASRPVGSEEEFQARRLALATQGERDSAILGVILAEGNLCVELSKSHRVAHDGPTEAERKEGWFGT